MKTQKRKWMIAGIAAVFLLLALLWAEWILDMQRPMSIKMLGDGSIQHVEASCVSAEGWQREELNHEEIQRLVRVMNGIKGEPVSPPPHGFAPGRWMVISVEKTDGKRRHMVFSDQTLVLDNDETYLLSKKDARQIERLFGEIL